MSYDFGVSFFGNAVAAPPPSPGSKPMDTYASNMLHAYALKQILGAYAGPLMRVRRSSDNAEQDIGYVTGGGMDTTALASFVGANDGFVTKLYDQMASGVVDAVQATSSKQPKVVSSGTYLGYLQFDGVDDYLVTHTTAVTALSFAGFIHVPTPPASGNGTYFGHPLLATSGNNGLACQYQTNNTSTNSYMFTGTSSFVSEQATFSSTYTSVVVVCDRLIELKYAADGASRRTGVGSSGTPSGAAFTNQDLNIGSDGSAQPCAIQLKEFLIWTVNQTSNLTGIFAAL